MWAGSSTSTVRRQSEIEGEEGNIQRGSVEERLRDQKRRSVKRKMLCYIIKQDVKDGLQKDTDKLGNLHRVLWWW